MNAIGFWDFALGAPLVGAGISFGFVVVKWAANFIAGRLDKREAQVDAGTTQLLDRMNEEIERVSEECTTLRARVTVTEEDLRHCRDEHAQCRAELMELRGLIQGRGDARNEAAVIVARDRVADKRGTGDKE